MNFFLRDCTRTEETWDKEVIQTKHDGDGDDGSDTQGLTGVSRRAVVY
jgi:hypothetical protein